MIDKQVEELLEYAEIESTEIGELCISLCETYNNRVYASEDFQEALKQEILSQLENFKENCTIVEKSQKFHGKWKVIQWGRNDGS